MSTLTAGAQSALGSLFGKGKNAKEVTDNLPENSFIPIPDGTSIFADVFSLKIEEKKGEFVLAAGYLINSPAEFANRALYQRFYLRYNPAIETATFSSTESRKLFWQYTNLIDFLWETNCIGIDGKFIRFPDPQPIAIAAALGRTIKTKTKNTVNPTDGKTYTNPGFLANIRKADTEFTTHDKIPLFSSPQQKQFPTKRIENDSALLTFFSKIPNQFIVDQIADRLKGMEPLPRGTEVIASITKITDDEISDRGNPLVKIQWKIASNNFDDKRNGGLIFQTVTANNQQGAMILSNLATVFGLIDEDGNFVGRDDMTLTEQFMGKSAMFYVGVSESGYNTIDTEFYPVGG